MASVRTLIVTVPPLLADLVKAVLQPHLLLDVADVMATRDRLMERLHDIAPDLVLLHGSLEKTPRKTEFNFSLNLNLPTGTMHATGAGADVLGSAKAAFAELEVQVKKHQAKLRKDYVWKRKRAIALPTPREAPSSD